MRLLKQPERGKRYFRKIILLTTITVLTLILFTSSLIFRFTRQSIAQSKYDMDIKALSQIKQAIDKQNQAIRSICMELYYSDNAGEILRTDWEKRGFFEAALKIKKADSNLSALYPFIHSIYYYNEKTQQFYTSYYRGEIIARDAFLQNMLNKYDPAPTLQPLLRKINIRDSTKLTTYETEYVFSYIMSNSPAGFSRSEPAVVLNIRLDHFLDEIKSVAMVDSHPGDFFALVTEGGVWFPDREYKGDSEFIDRLSDVFLSTIIPQFTQKRNLDILHETIGGTDYFVSYAKISGTELVIVRTQPYDEVFEPLNRTLDRIIVVTVIALCVAILASALVSWRIYRPIGGLMKLMKENLDGEKDWMDKGEVEYLRNVYVHTFRELKEVRARESMDQDLRKQAFWLQLFRDSLSEADVREAYERGIVRVDLSRPFYVWIIRIDNFDELSRLSNRDYNLSKYAINNILLEVLSNAYSCELCEYRNDRFCAFIPDPGEGRGEGEVYRDFERNAREAQRAVSRHLQFDLSVSVSSLVGGVRQLTGQINAANRNVDYRILFGKACFIDPLLVAKNNEERPYAYPSDLEEGLLQELRHGNPDEIEGKLDAILQAIRGMEYNDILISTLRLYNMVYSTLTELYENNFATVPDTLEMINTAALERRTLDEIRSILLEESRNAIAAVRSTKKVGRRAVMIQAVNALILRHYQDPAFCLSTIAGSLDKAPNYISILYKDAVGKSIAQTIQETRLKKAEELLLTTDYTIGKIIELTGFVNESNFYKNFKKQYGTTPSSLKMKRKVQDAQ